MTIKNKWDKAQAEAKALSARADKAADEKLEKLSASRWTFAILVAVAVAVVAVVVVVATG